MLLKSINLKYLYVALWTIGILYASLSSPEAIPKLKLFQNADKVIHFIMYSGLSFLLIPVFKLKGNYRKSFVISFLISLILGGILELIQSYLIKHRSGEIWDFLANLSGSVSGILFYNYFVRNLKIERIIFKT